MILVPNSNKKIIDNALASKADTEVFNNYKTTTDNKINQIDSTKANKADLANGRQYKGKVDYKTTLSTGYTTGKTVLPTTGNTVGDYWLVGEDNHYYQWNSSSKWDDVGTGDAGYNKLDEKITELGITVTTIPEYISVYTDSNGVFIFGVKSDGSIEWAKGIPTPVKNRIAELYLDIQEIQVQLEDKVSIELGKSLIDESYAKSISVSSSSEYISAYTDSNGKFLFGIRANGAIEWAVGIPTPIKNKITELWLDIQGVKKEISSMAFAVEENQEFIDVKTDGEKKILEATDKNGTKKFYGNVEMKQNVSVDEVFSAKTYSYSNDNLTDLEKALKKHGFSATSPIDWSESESLQIPIPRCAVVNFSNITSMPTTKFENMQGFVEFWDMQGNYFKKNTIMNAQGSSSMSYIKKNIAVDICNDEWVGDDTFSIRFGDWVSQDSFHLKAYYTDYFRGVGVVSYQLMEEISKSRGIMFDRPWKKALINMESINKASKGFGGISDTTLQLDTGARCVPDGFPCIVYLNGNFYGIFAWQLKKHRDNMHQTKDIAEHIHLDGTLGEDAFFSGTIDWTQFEVRNPKDLYCMDGTLYDADFNCKEIIDETSQYYNLDTDSSKIKKRKQTTSKVKKYTVAFSKVMQEIYNANVTYNTNKTAENLITLKTLYQKYFDVENQIDYLILSDVVKNIDGFIKNWQWTTYNGEKWYVNLYDVDMSFGGHFQGIQITEPLTNHVNVSTHLPSYYVITYWSEELQARYKELRDNGIVNTEHIVGLLNDWTKRICVDNYKKEWNKWSDSPCNGDNIINSNKWELVADEFGNYVMGNSITYSSTISYSVGDTCSYGISETMGYYTFKCIYSTIGVPPIKEFRHRDNIYRVKKWLDEEISNMDVVYNYN